MAKKYDFALKFVYTSFIIIWSAVHTKRLFKYSKICILRTYIRFDLVPPNSTILNTKLMIFCRQKCVPVLIDIKILITTISVYEALVDVNR